MRIALTRWHSEGLSDRPSPRKRLPPKKKTSSAFEFVSCLRIHDDQARLVRANLIMTGIIFSAAIDTMISLDYGILGCLQPLWHLATICSAVASGVKAAVQRSNRLQGSNAIDQSATSARNF